MSKKIISLVLFAAMLLCATVANATELAEKPTRVDYITVANLGTYDTLTSTMTPPGSNVGLLIPNYNLKDKITITSSLEYLANREYDIAIVFNGVISTDKNIDQVFINGDRVDLTDATKAATSPETGNTVVYTKFNVGKNKYAPHTIYDKTFQIKVFKDNGVKAPSVFDYQFTVEFVDTKAPSDWLNADLTIEDLRPATPAAATPADPMQYTGKYSWTAAKDPAPAVLPATIAGNAVVSVNSRLNVRTAASATSAIVGKLPSGTIVNVLAYSPTWSMIGTADGAVIGYVYSAYINIA